MQKLSDEMNDKLDAMTLRRLLAHLDNNKQVQNIDLMILAGFCRNCLGDWYREAAQESGIEISKEKARERIYGMPYDQWKEKYQMPATPEQMEAFRSR